MAPAAPANSLWWSAVPGWQQQQPQQQQQQQHEGHTSAEAGSKRRHIHSATELMLVDAHAQQQQCSPLLLTATSHSL
jgi:hypothetical protein